ncbi:unnamed protein product [Microthlaspi erraticum]|uniref:CCHC-type domain-containing protein n=1 Tax=Microthlaspi erraticum TaxID=1685480 RepID=A0A6D2KSP9_9BRAS|nr:unnamed protein product [Microthlaspi erraticum]
MAGDEDVIPTGVGLSGGVPPVSNVSGGGVPPASSATGVHVLPTSGVSGVGVTGTSGARSNEVAVVSPYTLYSSDNPGSDDNSCVVKRRKFTMNGPWSSLMCFKLSGKRVLSMGAIYGDVYLGCFPALGKLEATFLGGKQGAGQIKVQLVSCRQDGQSVLDYYGRLSKLWEELQMYQLIHGCVCGAEAKMANEKEEEKIHQFLMGLDDSRFGNICTNIIGTDPLPALGEIYNKIVREEQRLASAKYRDQQQDAVGFVARQSGSPNPSVRSQTQQQPENSILRNRNAICLHCGRTGHCSHCGRTGHEKRDCWQIVGFPDWWNERNGGRGQNSGRGRGGGRGAGAGRGRGQVTTAHATSSNSSTFPDFSADQWKILTHMIQE